MVTYGEYKIEQLKKSQNEYLGTKYLSAIQDKGGWLELKKI